MTAQSPLPSDVFADYQNWLSRQPLSENTCRTYLLQVRQYCGYIEEAPTEYGDPLREAHARDYAVRDYKTYLKMIRKLKPNTVNIALAAIDHFYGFLNMDSAHVRREELPQQAPRALDAEDQKRFLRAVERCSSVRDRAVALLLFYTGLRISECAALDTGDVTLSARKGEVVVRNGKGNAYRNVPLNAEARGAQRAWLKERSQRFAGSEDTAIFLSRQGVRLSTRAIDLLLRKLGKEAKVSISAHVLRHTCLTNLVRNGQDIVLVAEIAGHRRLETTRRYSLPTDQDRAKAMEALQVDY